MEYIGGKTKVNFLDRISNIQFDESVSLSTIDGGFEYN